VHASAAAQPAKVQSTHLLMLSMVGHHQCADTSCMQHAATDGDCCKGSGCTPGFFIPAAQPMTLLASTLEQYWILTRGGIGLTLEPDVGPPISLA
jgi:hypothetical protein